MVPAAISTPPLCGSAVNSAKVDCGSSKPHWVFGASPCLTKSRGQSRAFWSLQHARPFSIRELARLQGLELADMKVPVTDAQMGALLGNGFTATVIMRVMSVAITLAEAADMAQGDEPATRQPQASQNSQAPARGDGAPSTASKNSSVSATGDGPATGGQPATGGGAPTTLPAAAVPAFRWMWDPDADTPESLL